MIYIFCIYFIDSWIRGPSYVVDASKAERYFPFYDFSLSDLNV